MKKPSDNVISIFVAYAVWLVAIGVVAFIACTFIPLRTGYLGRIPFSNFDGIHYLKIAGEGYFDFGEAFFPLYPLIIRYISHAIRFVPAEFTAMGISLACFISALVILYRELIPKYGNQSFMIILTILTFPTAFFFGTVYTESLFLLFSVLTWSWARNGKYIPAGIAGALAGATRISGILLVILIYSEYRSRSGRLTLAQWVSLAIIPSGLIFYMYYLYLRSGDPLLFFHVQEAFGANRSSSDIILLPQVLWRYLKIIFTAYLKPTPISYVISVSELMFTFFAYLITYLGWRSRKFSSYILYLLAVITLPTLTGTLSSMPRYILTAFPLFIILGSYDNRGRLVYFVISAALQIIGAALFFRGWFIA